MTRWLLDTHTLLWWINGDRRLSKLARSKIEDRIAPIYVSAVSAWEIATKHRIGKLPGVGSLIADFESTLRGEQFEDLAISVTHARLSGGLPGHHEDPFDRMLIAQSLAEGMPILSNDARFDQYGVNRIW